MKSTDFAERITSVTTVFVAGALSTLVLVLLVMIVGVAMFWWVPWWVIGIFACAGGIATVCAIPE